MPTKLHCGQPLACWRHRCPASSVTCELAAGCGRPTLSAGWAPKQESGYFLQAVM